MRHIGSGQSGEFGSTVPRAKEPSAMSGKQARGLDTLRPVLRTHVEHLIGQIKEIKAAHKISSIEDLAAQSTDSPNTASQEVLTRLAALLEQVDLAFKNNDLSQDSEKKINSLFHSAIETSEKITDYAEYIDVVSDIFFQARRAGVEIGEAEYCTELYDNISSMGEGSVREKSKALLALARAEIRKGNNPDELLKSVHQYTTTIEDNDYIIRLELLADLGRTVASYSDKEKALEFFQESKKIIIANNPTDDDPDTKYLCFRDLAEEMAKCGLYKEAELFAKAVPDNYRGQTSLDAIRLEMGRMANKNKDYTQAEDIASRIESDNYRNSLYLGIVLSHINSGDFTKAQQYIQKFFLGLPDVSYEGLAYSRIALKKAEQGIDMSHELALAEGCYSESDRHSFSLISDFSMLYAFLRDYDKAREYLDKIASIPDKALGLAKMASVQAGHGIDVLPLFDEAVDLFLQQERDSDGHISHKEDFYGDLFAAMIRAGQGVHALEIVRNQIRDKTFPYTHQFEIKKVREAMVHAFCLKQDFSSAQEVIEFWNKDGDYWIDDSYAILARAQGNAALMMIHI